jgi:hypothetical protein
MRGMEHSAVGKPPASAPQRTDATETGTPPGTLHIEHEKLPSLGGTGPILPEWLRRLFRRTDTPASR